MNKLMCIVLIVFFTVLSTSYSLDTCPQVDSYSRVVTQALGVCGIDTTYINTNLQKLRLIMFGQLFDSFAPLSVVCVAFAFGIGLGSCYLNEQRSTTVGDIHHVEQGKKLTSARPFGSSTTSEILLPVRPPKTQ
mmetsp:Transcript_9514/g.14322  ORF Transcript_9514/g.14322 Transcript_9514/m.14322 type:complete len:134 (+) Transcript_9514:79-480(+)